MKTLTKLGLFIFTTILSASAFAECLCSSAPKKLEISKFRKGQIYHNLIVNYGIAYKVADDQVLRFDICYPEKEASKDGYPLIVYYHGGAWQGGERYSGYGFFNDEIRRYNSEGIAVATVTYRFANAGTPRRSMEVCVVDCMDALRYMTKYAKDLRINPEKIGVYGHSAGGHLSFMMALADQSKFIGDASLKDVKYKVLCAVPQSGPTSFVDADADGSFMKNINQMRVPLAFRVNDMELRKLLSPSTYVSKDAPKMLILQGEKDTIVPQNSAKFIYKKLQEAGAKDVRLVISENAQHSFENAKKPNNDELAKIRQAFFIESLKD